MFGFLKNKKKKPAKTSKRDKIVLEGINAIFSFLDGGLSEDDDDYFSEMTTQLFFVFYIIGMAQLWSRSKNPDADLEAQLWISYVVVGGIRDRYGIELKDWNSFIFEFHSPDEHSNYFEHEVVRRLMKRGSDDFGMYLALGDGFVNPLSSRLSEWYCIEFYNENGEEERDLENYRGEIPDILTEEEYDFFYWKIFKWAEIFAASELDTDRQSQYLKLKPQLETYPFKSV